MRPLVQPAIAKLCASCRFFTEGRYGHGKCGVWQRLVKVDDTCRHHETDVRKNPERIILVVRQKANPKMSQEALDALEDLFWDTVSITDGDEEEAVESIVMDAEPIAKAFQKDGIDITAKQIRDFFKEGNPKKFRRERVASPKKFDPRSFRTEIPPGAKDHRIIVGCPKGQWDAKRGRCRVGTRAQAILHPKGENPCSLPNGKMYLHETAHDEKRAEEIAGAIRNLDPFAQIEIRRGSRGIEVWTDSDVLGR